MKLFGRSKASCPLLSSKHDKITPGQDSSSTSKLKDLFSDVEPIMFLPFLHEVGTVMAELDRGTVVWMVRTEQDGVRFIKTRPTDDKTKAISGLMSAM